MGRVLFWLQSNVFYHSVLTVTTLLLYKTRPKRRNRDQIVPLCETYHIADTCESGMGVYRITGVNPGKCPNTNKAGRLQYTMPQPHMQIQIKVVMMLEIFQVPRALSCPNALCRLIHWG